jgi:hypothetical protein
LFLKEPNGVTSQKTEFFKWKNSFYQLLNVHNISDARHIEIYSAEPLLLGNSSLAVETATGSLKKYKSRSSDQIPTELIQAGGETLLPGRQKLINSTWSKKELPDHW